MARQNVSSGSPYEPILGISRAVRIGYTIAVAGTAPIGPDGKTVAPGDVAAQARRCIEIARIALEQLGASLLDVIRTRTLLMRIDDWEAVGRVHGEIDIGVHQDGLVHISAMADKFVDDPRKIAKTGDLVKVKVLEVDLKRRRISLSMRLGEAPGAEKLTPPSQRKESLEKQPPQRTKETPPQTAMAAAFAKLKLDRQSPVSKASLHSSYRSNFRAETFRAPIIARAHRQFPAGSVVPHKEGTPVVKSAEATRLLKISGHHREVKMKKMAPLLILVFCVGFFACGLRQEKIKTILESPESFQGRIVTVGGKAGGAFKLPFMSQGLYMIDDGTGSLTVITKKGLPATGETVTVRGKIQSAFQIFGKTYGIAIVDVEE